MQNLRSETIKINAPIIRVLHRLSQRGAELQNFDSAWEPKTALQDSDLIQLIRLNPEYKSDNFRNSVTQLRNELKSMDLGNCKAASTLRDFMGIFAITPQKSESDYNPDIASWINQKLYVPAIKGLKGDATSPKYQRQLRQIYARPMKDLRTVTQEILNNRVNVNLSPGARNTLSRVETMLNQIEDIMLERESGTHLKTLHEALVA